LVISGNSEAIDIAEAKLLWDQSNNATSFYCPAYFFFLVGVGVFRVSKGAK
jgi:hypothetical protein